MATRRSTKRTSVAARPIFGHNRVGDAAGQGPHKSPMLQVLKATARTATLAWAFEADSTPTPTTTTTGTQQQQQQPGSCPVVQIVKAEGDDPQFTRVYEGSDDTYLVENLKPETLYRFKIRVWDNDEQDFSKTFSETAVWTTDESKIIKVQLRLYRAVTENDVDAFHQLMDDNRTEINIEMRDKNGKTMLMIAALKGTGPMVEAILSYGANQKTTTQSKKTPLSLAVSYSNLPAVLALIKEPDAINYPDQGGSTPLMWAVEHANFKNGLEIVSALISAGANVDQEDSNGLTALERLCGSGGNAKAARMLLENGAKIVNRVEGKKKLTTVMMAALNGYKDLCVELIDHWGADLSAKTDFGQTAKMMAEGSGHSDLALILEKKTLKDEY
ncbi:ankyrin repeat-containing domain protein [Chytriomyces cf. hyalinus JEL632]|nr:ankyrin repeat-containing domain protein [Chytriomyces cf. hyalinus JEL632]